MTNDIKGSACMLVVSMAKGTRVMVLMVVMAVLQGDAIRVPGHGLLLKQPDARCM